MQFMHVQYYKCINMHKYAYNKMLHIEYKIEEN